MGYFYYFGCLCLGVFYRDAPSFSCLFSGLAFSPSGHRTFYFSGDVRAWIPFTHSLLGTLSLPGPAGSEKANALGNRRLQFWMGAGCLSEGLIDLNS